MSFLQALRTKYVSDSTDTETTQSNGKKSSRSDEPIEISGKIVEEVGFEKIRRQQATLKDLRVVLLDGMCIKFALSDADGDDKDEDMVGRIRKTCPKIQELDLSRNLFETWVDVDYICQGLEQLRSLKLKSVEYLQARFHRLT